MEKKEKAITGSKKSRKVKISLIKENIVKTVDLPELKCNAFRMCSVKQPST